MLFSVFRYAAHNDIAANLGRVLVEKCCCESLVCVCVYAALSPYTREIIYYLLLLTRCGPATTTHKHTLARAGAPEHNNNDRSLSLHCSRIRTIAGNTMELHDNDRSSSFHYAYETSSSSSSSYVGSEAAAVRGRHSTRSGVCVFTDEGPAVADLTISLPPCAENICRP